MNGHNGNMAGTGAQFIRKDLSGYGKASNLKMNEHIKELMSQGQQIYHLAFGQSPFPVPAKLEAGLVKNAHRNEYVSMVGVKPLREAISKFHREFDTGIPEATLDAENIVVADGSKMAIYLILMVTDTALVLKDPSWTTYKPQGVLTGCKKTVIVQTSFEEKWKMTPQNLEQALKDSNMDNEAMTMIFNNPCNPSGCHYTEQELEDLSAVMRKYRMIVISDEIYSNLTFSSDYTSISKYYPEGTIVTTGLSKWASAGGWRVGYAMFPPGLSAIREVVSSASSHTYSCCPAPQQYAAIEFLEDFDACRDFMLHTKRILEVVNHMCVSKLRPVGVKVHPAAAGYYVYPDFSILREKLAVRNITTGQQMCDAILAEARVSLLPGASVHLSPEDSLTTRLCYINFDGGKALEASRDIGLSKPLTQEFINTYCDQTAAAIDSLVRWCETVLGS